VWQALVPATQPVLPEAARQRAPVRQQRAYAPVPALQVLEQRQRAVARLEQQVRA